MGGCPQNRQGKISGDREKTLEHHTNQNRQGKNQWKQGKKQWNPNKNQNRQGKNSGDGKQISGAAKTKNGQGKKQWKQGKNSGTPSKSKPTGKKTVETRKTVEQQQNQPPLRFHWRDSVFSGRNRFFYKDCNKTRFLSKNDFLQKFKFSRKKISSLE